MRTPRPIRLMSLVIAAFAAVHSLRAQAVSVYASTNPDSGVVHIMIESDYGNPAVPNAVNGFYNDGLIHNDSNRLDGAVLMSRVELDNYDEVWGVTSSLYDYAATHSYDNINNNCGSAVDYALESNGIDTDNFFSYENIAIMDTAANVIDEYWNEWAEYQDYTGTSMDAVTAMASIWDGFKDFFE